MTLSFLAISLLLFAFGMVIGSFLNVVIYRSITGESWVIGWSKCEHCQHRIRWYDNVPLLSYVILRGKCRDCKKSIALTHPVLEIIMGSLFVWWYWFGAFFFELTKAPFQTIQPLFWLFVGILLIVIVAADLLYYIIPDEAVGLLLILTVSYRIALTLLGEMQLTDLIRSVIAMVLVFCFFGGLWLVTKGRGMGLGDVKLVVPLSLLLGWPKVFVGMFLAFIFGSVVSLLFILFKRLKFGQVVPFGPFLILGTITALLYGENLLQWYIGLIW